MGKIVIVPGSSIQMLKDAIEFLIHSMAPHNTAILETFY
jgi:hypothetical protein